MPFWSTSRQAERRHKAKASNALRRMAQGHQLDETEQGGKFGAREVAIGNLNSLMTLDSINY